MAVLFNLSFLAPRTKEKEEKRCCCYEKKLYIFELISFQYFLVDVWKSFIMSNELTQILWHNRLV